jgi:hypothetical protein
MRLTLHFQTYNHCGDKTWNYHGNVKSDKETHRSDDNDNYL